MQSILSKLEEEKLFAYSNRLKMSAFNLQYIVYFFTIPAAINFSYGQYFPEHDELTPAFHKERRELLREKLPSNSVAIFFTNPVRNRSNDIDYVYHPDPDFFYLTGYTEPNAVLLLFKNEQQDKEGNKFNEIIFVQPKSEWDEMWFGKRLGVKGVKEKLGFGKVYPNADFLYYDPGFKNFDRILYKPFNNDIRNTEDNGDLYDLVEWFKEKAGITDTLQAGKKGKSGPKLDHKSLEKIMGELREIKTPEEIALLKKAIKITCLGQNEAMKAAYPGISEKSLQAIQEFVHRIYGSEAEGYPPIVGSGENSCILHYEENTRAKTDSGDLVLMDIGAEYNGYSADITRTIPVSGTFTREQKQIYDIVLKAQQASIDNCKQGESYRNFENAGREAVTEGLMELGIIHEESEAFSYLPHGISHPIGLDVHDAGDITTLKENMVITIEPGIYIPEGSPCDKKWWKTGIRIEDDLLVNKKGCEVLSTLSPRTTDAIEAMMKEPGMLDKYSFPVLDSIK